IPATHQSAIRGSTSRAKAASVPWTDWGGEDRRPVIWAIRRLRCRGIEGSIGPSHGRSSGGVPLSSSDRTPIRTTLGEVTRSARGRSETDPYGPRAGTESRIPAKDYATRSPRAGQIGLARSARRRPLGGDPGAVPDRGRRHQPPGRGDPLALGVLQL